MHSVRRNQRQRPQHKGVFQYFGPRQNKPVEIAHQIAVQQHVDIQRQTSPIRRITSVISLDKLKPTIQFHQWQVGKRRHYKIEERPALDPHRLTFEYRRTADIHQKTREGFKARLQMGMALDIATETKINLSQRHPRSISTPTPPVAAGTAPGLVSLRRIQVILNSLINTSHSRSANVSTSWNCACSAKAWIRDETLA